MEITHAASPKTIVDKTIQPLIQKYRIAGGAVVLYLNGKPYIYHYGYEQNTNNTPINNNSIFEIGSLSKLFTNLLLALQINAGNIQLNQPLTYYWSLPHASEATQKITLKHLATYTASLPFSLPDNIKTPDDLIQFFTQWRPQNPVSSHWQYSNFSIGLLDIALESVTHENYEQLLQKYILQPLHMQPIGIKVPKAYAVYYAQGYNLQGQAVSKVDDKLLVAAGALKASVQNMQLFLQAAIGQTGVPVNILKAMQTTQTPYVDVGNWQQGLGWEIHPLTSQTEDMLLSEIVEKNLDALPATILSDDKQIFDGNALIDKAGATSGFRSYIAVIPNQKTGIVILVNRHIPNKAIVAAGREILFTLKHSSPN